MIGEKSASAFGTTSATRHSGASQPIGSTARSSIRSRGAKTTVSTMSGCPSTTSSKTAIFPHPCRPPRRSPPVPTGSAFASGVLLMPLHNPIRLAEDIATVDVISGGRFELGVGIGFKREEFAGFGVSTKERGARTDQSLDIIRRALAGETVTFKSDFFDFQNVRVTPEPIQKPRPPIWLGGFTPAALRRAVRFGDGFTVPGANRDVYDRYVAELEKVNRPTDNLRFASGFWFLVVSEDPEKTFAEAADHVIYQVNNYSVWLQAGGLQPLSPHPQDPEKLNQSR